MIFLILLAVAPQETGAFARPRSEPVETCDPLLGYDCPSHYFCARDHTQSGPRVGTCRCNPFYGFYGPHCQKLSATSYFFAALCGCTLVLSAHALYLNAIVVRGLMSKQLGGFRMNATGRTLLFNLVGNLPIMSVATGLGLIAIDVDKQMIYHEFLREGSIAAYFGLFILYCFSISLVSCITSVALSSRPYFHYSKSLATSFALSKRITGLPACYPHHSASRLALTSSLLQVWIERVEISVRGIQYQALREERARAYRRLLYGSSIISVAVISFCFIVLHSIIYVVGFGCLVCIGTGLSYRYAGRRVYNLLVVQHPLAVQHPSSWFRSSMNKASNLNATAIDALRPTLGGLAPKGTTGADDTRTPHMVARSTSGGSSSCTVAISMSFQQEQRERRQGIFLRHQQAIADHIKTTAHTVSSHCLLIALWFVWLFFTLPSATPTYKRQNDLPARWLQGQIPLFLAQM
jgi:hypothetical protein